MIFKLLEFKFMKLPDQQIKYINNLSANNSGISSHKLNKKNNQKECRRRITTQYYTSGIKLPVFKTDSECMNYIGNWEKANGNKSLVD